MSENKRRDGYKNQRCEVIYPHKNKAIILLSLDYFYSCIYLLADQVNNPWSSTICFHQKF